MRLIFNENKILSLDESLLILTLISRIACFGRIRLQSWFIVKFIGSSFTIVCRHCPVGYVCIGVGPNPNHGYTNFDNFMWSMLTTFQLITLDYWENVYNIVSIQHILWDLSITLV